MSEVAENSVDKRDSILQGAFDEFCENGFLAASMDRISKRAGASKRTVYRYFESKEVLFQTLMLRQWRVIADNLKVSYQPGMDIREQLIEMGRAQARLYTSPEVMNANKMLMTEILRDPELVREIQNEVDYTASFEQRGRRRRGADDPKPPTSGRRVHIIVEGQGVLAVHVGGALGQS